MGIFGNLKNKISKKSCAKPEKNCFELDIVFSTPSTFGHFLNHGGIMILASPDTQETCSPRNLALFNTMGTTDCRQLRAPVLSALINQYQNLDDFLAIFYAQIDGLREFVAQLPQSLRQPIKLTRYSTRSIEDKSEQFNSKKDEQIHFIIQNAPKTAILFIEDVEPEAMPLLIFFAKKTGLPIVVSMKSRKVTPTKDCNGSYISSFINELFSKESLQKMADSNNAEILNNMENPAFVNDMIRIGVKPDEIAHSLLSQLYSIYVFSDEMLEQQGLLCYPSESFSFYVDNINNTNDVVKNNSFYEKMMLSPTPSWAHLMANEVVEPKYDLKDYAYSGVSISEYIENLQDFVLEQKQNKQEQT